MQSALKKTFSLYSGKQVPMDSDSKLMLAKLKKELEYLHRDFDTATDPIMIDSLIYQIMSVNMKYKFFLNECRTEGIKKN